jgi:hypothetical protein
MPYSYGYDGIKYFGSYGDREEAMDAAVDNREDENVAPQTIYIAKQINTKERLKKDSAWAIAAAVMDKMEMEVEDFIGGEGNDDVFTINNKDEAPSEALTQLGKEIIDLVLSKCRINRFGVKDVEKWEKEDFGG